MKALLTFRDGQFYLGDAPFYIASGDMHYFRYYDQSAWERRLRLMKEFGLTCVQTYVPWNLHEPEKGHFCFEGRLDIEAFFARCEAHGLKVLLRPSVYMCSEWDFGGLPYWLLRDRDSMVRTTDEKFMAHAKAYYEVLLAKVRPFLSTNGGPILAMAVENEYGSYGSEYAYIEKTREIYRENGIDVPLYCADGFEEYKMQSGSPRDILTTLDAASLTEKALCNLAAYQPGRPVCISEFWGGKGQQAGGRFARESAEAVAERYRDALKKGAYVNFYMFCGGTNFGFMNGALEGRYRSDAPDAPDRYIPYATSYDVDAPVTENGEPTEKYFALRKVLCEHLGTPYTEERPPYRTQRPTEIELLECAPLFDNLEALSALHTHCGGAPVMEDLGQDYGFILYRTHVPHTDDYKRNIRIYGLADRATIYGNGRYLGTYMRDAKNPLITFRVPEEGLRLDILVENMGRICYGYRMAHDRKGIREFVKIGVYLQDDEREDRNNYKQQTGYEVWTLPLRELSGLSYVPFAAYERDEKPAFFRGRFFAEPGTDTFVDMRRWVKGNVWVNGFHLGRYWNIGPQQTLYVPGELLRRENEIVVFELHSAPERPAVSFSDRAMLDGLESNVDYNGSPIAGETVPTGIN